MPGLIEKNLDKAIFDYSIVYSDSAGHAHIIAKEAIGKFDVVIAVGGDGTVNEIASGHNRKRYSFRYTTLWLRKRPFTIFGYIDGY